MVLVAAAGDGNAARDLKAPERQQQAVAARGRTALRSRLRAALPRAYRASELGARFGLDRTEPSVRPDPLSRPRGHVASAGTIPRRAAPRRFALAGSPDSALRQARLIVSSPIVPPN